MASLLVDHTMAARKRKDPPSESSSGESPALLSIKLPADVVKTARIVASLNDASMSDLLGDLLRPILKKLEDDGFAKRRKERGGSD